MLPKLRRTSRYSYSRLFLFAGCSIVLGWFSASTSFAQSLIRTHQGPDFEAHFGTSQVGLGDVDGDGIPDYAIGSPAYVGLDFVGVYSGLTGNLLYQAFGANTQGQRLLALDDSDGDGIRDFVSVGYDYDKCSCEPRVVLFSGASGIPIYELPLAFNNELSEYRANLTGLSDWNGDGVKEFAVTVNYFPDGVANTDMRVVSGLDGQILWSVDTGSTPLFTSFGSVAAVPDVDGDLVGDMRLWGGWRDSSNNLRSRKVYLSGANGNQIAGPFDQADRRVLQVTDLGYDFDGDGITDQVSSDRLLDGRFVLSVESGTLPGGTLFTIPTDLDGVFTFPTLAAGEDVTGDGIPDLLTRGFGTSIQLRSANNLAVQYSIPGIEGDQFASFASASFVDDLNFDGLPDWIAGSPIFAGKTFHEGIANVYSGSDPVSCSEAVTGSLSGAFGRMGHSVSIDGGRAIVGAPGESGLDGAAYVFERTATGAWEETGRLVSPLGGQASQFGWDVALFGELAVVGAPYEDSPNGLVADLGAAYVFRLVGGTWTFESRLQPTSLTAEARFGLSVACDSDNLLIGAPRWETGGNSNVGAVYPFAYDMGTWVEHNPLTPDITAPDQWFGASVALHGLNAAVGAPYESAAFPSQGGAYLFERQGNPGWVMREHLYSPTPSDFEFFGISVDVSDTHCVVGEEYHDEFGPRSGTAQVFGLNPMDNQWGFDQSLLPSTGATDDIFGNAVAIDGGNIIVSARGHDLAGTQTGTAFVFDLDQEFGTWDELYRLTSSNPVFEEDFGNDVGLSQGTAIIGATGTPTDGGSGDEQGSTTFARIDRSDCDGNGTPDICDIDAGLVTDCDGNLVPDSCDIAGDYAFDCNGNGLPDTCDVLSGFSTDCNQNGVLDECEIGSGDVADCNANGIPDSCDLLTGTIMDANSNGIPDECELVGLVYCSPAAPNSAVATGAKIQAFGSVLAGDNQLSLSVIDMPTEEFGLLISSGSPGFTAFPGGSFGILCLGGLIGRHKSDVVSSGPEGVANFPVDLTNIPTPNGPTAISAGTTYYFQCWYRDFLMPLGSVSNFSDAVEITFL